MGKYTNLGVIIPNKYHRSLKYFNYKTLNIKLKIHKNIMSYEH